MATYKPFRELVQPGTNFNIMGRAKLWFALSVLICGACVAMLFVNKAWRGEYMNWSTDFKGGTEMIFGFHKKGTDSPVEVDAGKIRKALQDGSFHNFEVSEYSWEEETSRGTVHASGTLVRTPDFGAVAPAVQDQVATELATAFTFTDPKTKKVEQPKVTWSGDRVYVRSEEPVDWKKSEQLLGGHGLKVKPWDKEEAERYGIAEEGTGEYNAQLAVEGIDGRYRAALEKGLGGDVEVHTVNVYGVGAKAGNKLRNDAVTSMFYAIVLIMLYLGIRFDIRYAPGAVIAMLHDAIVVIGAFALTWDEVSLTTVAALMTVVGYSVNDTVIIFDRIRENAHTLKDKKYLRIMNISINETLSRSLLSSLTVFVTTLMMNIFGTGLVRNFAFAMNVGVITGTYSSIFIASPVALWIHERYYAGKGPSAKQVRAAKAAEDEAIEDDGDGGEEAGA